VRKVSYVYDAQGRLVQMTDWAGQITRWRYDQVSRPTLMLRPQGEKSQRRYDAASRLTRLRHYRDDTTRLQFDYDLDRRSNRTRTQELTRKAVPVAETRTLLFDDAALAYTGTWLDSAPFKTTSDPFGILRVMAVGHTLTFTYGTGPDHGRFDVYVNHTLWESFDGYAPVADEATVIIPLTEEGWNSFEIRNTSDKAAASSGITLRFKSLIVESQDYQGQIITYTYDGLSRLAAADHADDSRHYAYLFDVAGNRTQEQVSIGITTTTTHFTYNTANQMTARQIGSDTPLTLTYDPNGNMTSDGVMAYTWNRANRLAMVNNGSYNTHYTTDGDHNRRSQTIGGIVNQYLLDTQPGLALVLRETTSTQTTHYAHGPMGVQTIQQDSDWYMPLTDGLGSVRSELDAFGQVKAAQQYDPYGQPYDQTGDWVGSFAFTGEQRDDNGLQYHRARYYNPGLGAWTAEDPLETPNRYGYAEGNTINMVDTSGLECNLPLSYMTYNLPSKNAHIDLAKGQCTALTGKAYEDCIRLQLGIRYPGLLSSSVVIGSIRGTKTYGTYPTVDSACGTQEDVYKDVNIPGADGNIGITSTCSPKPSSQIGTIVGNSVYSHDHFNRTSDPSVGNSPSVINQEIGFLVIWGQSGYIDVLDTNDLDFQITSVGVTKISPRANVKHIDPATGKLQATPSHSIYRSDFSGTSSTIGNPDSIAAGDNVLFVHVPGWNNTYDYVPHRFLEIGVLPRGNYSDNDRFVLQGIQVSGGDSGGGHFDTNGFLIGVLERQGSSTPYVSIGEMIGNALDSNNAIINQVVSKVRL